MRSGKSICDFDILRFLLHVSQSRLGTTVTETTYPLRATNMSSLPRFFCLRCCRCDCAKLPFLRKSLIILDSPREEKEACASEPYLNHRSGAFNVTHSCASKIISSPTSRMKYFWRFPITPIATIRSNTTKPRSAQRWRRMRNYTFRRIVIKEK